MPETKDKGEDVALTFVNELMAQMGEDISGSEKEERRQELLDELDERTDRAMLEALSEKKLKELDQKMTEGMNDEMLEEFLENSGADFEKAVMGAMKEMAEDYLKGNESTKMTNLGGIKNEELTEVEPEDNVKTEPDDNVEAEQGKVKNNAADIVAAGVAEMFNQTGEEK